ncbi:MAG: dimethylarginine dimethylaminohydrolase family protein [Bacteroidota bacterium]
MFSQAIVRKPSRSLINGITEAELGAPDYQRALQQHEAYITALRTCGLSVHIMDPDEAYPDSVFVEDTALLTPQGAVITRPGAPSRRGETEDIRNVVAKYFDTIQEITAPGILDAGDVMMVGDHYYIGLSDRTNPVGAEQLIAILKSWGLSGSTVELSNVLHLKTGISYLENDHLLVSGEFIDRSEFADYHCIEVPEQEAYAANSLWINERVLVPRGHPQTRQKISELGYEIIELDCSEFQKLDGGLSCLSLRF